MSNFKFNTTTDLVDHPRTIIRSDLNPDCSKSLKDFGFEDLENSDLRVLTGGTYYTAKSSTTTSNPTTINVTSAYAISNVLNTQYDSSTVWPVGILPIREGSSSTWRAAKATNSLYLDTYANMVVSFKWDSNYTLSIYKDSVLMHTCSDCPQVMLDIQAPGGAGADGYGWRSSIYDYRGYSGGGGGGGGFATILFDQSCKAVRISQDSSGTIKILTGNSNETTIGTITKGGTGSGRTGGSGGTVSLTAYAPEAYIINTLVGGAGGNGYTEASWRSELIDNEQYGAAGGSAGGDRYDGFCSISLSPRIVNGSSYLSVSSNAGNHQKTQRYGEYNLYPGGGGGGSVMGKGGTGQSSSSNTAYNATAGGIGAGGGGGGTKANSCTAKAAAGGAGRIVFYVPNS